MPAFILEILQLPDDKTVKDDTIAKNISPHYTSLPSQNKGSENTFWLINITSPGDLSSKMGKERRGTNGLPGPEGCSQELSLTCDVSSKF